jgi:hypothetical protein
VQRGRADTSQWLAARRLPLQCKQRAQPAHRCIKIICSRSAHQCALLSGQFTVVAVRLIRSKQVFTAVISEGCSQVPSSKHARCAKR